MGSRTRRSFLHLVPASRSPPDGRRGILFATIGGVLRRATAVSAASAMTAARRRKVARVGNGNWVKDSPSAKHMAANNSGARRKRRASTRGKFGQRRSCQGCRRCSRAAVFSSSGLETPEVCRNRHPSFTLILSDGAHHGTAFSCDTVLGRRRGLGGSRLMKTVVVCWLHLKPILQAVRRARGPMLLIVFAVSMFLGAALLFLVEPMLAKMALPLLGGTPAVWNTCLVFFRRFCWPVICTRMQRRDGWACCIDYAASWSRARVCCRIAAAPPAWLGTADGAQSGAVDPGHACSGGGPSLLHHLGIHAYAATMVLAVRSPVRARSIFSLCRQ